MPGRRNRSPRAGPYELAEEIFLRIPKQVGQASVTAHVDAADKDGWNGAVLLHQQASRSRQLVDRRLAADADRALVGLVLDEGHDQDCALVTDEASVGWVGGPTGAGQLGVGAFGEVDS